MPKFQAMMLDTNDEGQPAGVRYSFALTWPERLAVLFGARVRLQSTFKYGESWPKYHPEVRVTR